MPDPSPLSRRSILKAAGAALAGLGLPVGNRAVADNPKNDSVQMAEFDYRDWDQVISFPYGECVRLDHAMTEGSAREIMRGRLLSRAMHENASRAEYAFHVQNMPGRTDLYMIARIYR